MKFFGATILALAMLTGPAWGQATQAPSAPPPAPLATPSPNYTTLILEATINRSAQEVWARVGRFCDITEWIGAPCVITSGKDGELGAIRLVNGVLVEPIVAVTPLSYTYTFPVRVGIPYNMAHNTLEARSIDANTSKIVYAFFWDNSALPEADREREISSRRTRITAALQNIKKLVESGTPRR